MKKLTTRIIAMLLIIAMTMSLMPTTFAAEDGGTFTDVGKGHWAYDYVEQAVALGLFRGVTETTFNPSGTMTRGMFMTVLNRMSGVPVDNSAPSGFEDVATGKYYTGAIAWAVKTGITTGITDTLFAPEAATTRQQAAAFLYRYANSVGLELTEGEAVSFTDEAKISSYAKEAVSAMAAAGIIIGYTDGSFQPNKTITRAEAATMFIRFMENALPAANYYSVSFMAQDAVVTVDGKETAFCAISERESLTFSVEALENYAITGVTASSGKLEKNEDGTWTLSSVTENVVISVLTQSTLPETYTISFDVRNAQVLVDNVAVTQVTVTEGEDLTFTALADENCAIEQVLASAGTLTDNGEGEYTLTDITSDVEITVVAAENQQPVDPEEYTINFVTDEGIKIYVDGVETDTATVSSADASFTFVYALTEEHTQIYTAEVTPNGNLNRAGNAYVLSGITGDTTITITTGIELFTVTFFTEDGASAVETQIVEYMGTVSKPEDPTMDNHFFGGWYADELLVYDYDFSTPVTADITLYGGFGAVVDTVYLDGLNGFNGNDGATPETALYSGSWATKVAAHSTTKTIVLLSMPYVVEEEIWDASEVEGGIKVIIDEGYLAEYGAYAIYVEGDAKLTVNNWHLTCQRSEDDYIGATLAVIARSYLYDENGNAVYDDEGQPVMFFGDLTMINCSGNGFGTFPTGVGGYGMFNNYCFTSYGALTLIGGEYWNNVGTDGAVIDMINDTSALTVDGVEFHHNESRIIPGVTYADGTGGAISSTNLDKITIRNCYFHDNTAEEGGAIYISNGEYVYLENNIFENNHSNTNGGAILIPFGKATLTLKGNNQFIGNTASSGGALWLYNPQTIPGGTFRNNEATAIGDAIYSSKALTITPDGEQALALDDAFYCAEGKGISIGGSVAGNEGTILAEVAAAVPGMVLAVGAGYTLTEADLAKFGCSMDGELELDTEKNVIKLKEVKDDDDDDEGGDGEDNEPHNLTTVYLSGRGNDANDGTTTSTAVATFAKAKGLLAKDGTIVICGEVKVTGETWSLEPETFGNAKVVRAENYTNGYLINVSAALTLKNITIDGQNISASKSPIYSSSGTIMLEEGAVLENLVNTGAYGAVIYGYRATVTIDGAIIRNCRGNSSYGAMIYAGTVTMSDGAITGCTSTGTYGGGIYATNITMAGGEITNNSFTGTYGGALAGGYQGIMLLSGGLIEGNTCYGAAVSGPTAGTLTMTGGEVKNNSSSNANSSGAGVTGTGTVELLGGVISGNKAKGNGGGYYAGFNGTTIIDGVTIENNESSKQGGGIWMASTGKVEFRSGIIRNNTATTEGDGIYVSKDGIATFIPNEKGLTVDGEIYLPNNTYFKSSGNLMGDLTHLNGKLLFNFQKIVAGSVVAVPVDGYTLTEADLAKIGCTGCNMSYEFSDGKIITKTFPVEGISLDKTELTVMATYTDTLTATLNPADASNMAVTWTSTNNAVARVSGNLLDATVTGVSAGEAIIRATAVDGGVYAECVVTVTENTTPIDSITLDKTSMKLEGGDVTTLSATINPWNAYSMDVSWSSSDTKVIRITGTGSTVTITALEDGTATVTATAADGKSAKCDITVADTKVTGIIVSPETLELEVGNTASVNGVIEPSDATVQDVIWTVDDESVATITVFGSNAVVFGKAEGTTTVTATTVDGGFEGTIEVKVVKAQENQMSLDLDSLNLIIYQSFNITALFEKSGQDVTWTTSDPETVEILNIHDNQVTIKAVEAGSATITATSSDGQVAECLVNVEVRIAGTQDVVYVEDANTSSDSNDGLTPETPIKNLTTALERVAVDGIIYIQGSTIRLNDGDNITLPKEIYGDAKIVIITTHIKEDWGDGYIYERDQTPFFMANGYTTFSDVVIDYSEAGDTSYALSIGKDDKVIVSNGTVFLGSNEESSQQAMYLTDGEFLMNGGCFDSFKQTGAYGAFRCIGGTFTMNGGSIKNCGCRNYGGALGLDGSTFVMNGGELTGNVCKQSAGGAIHVGDSIVTINGGRIYGNVANSKPNSTGINLDRNAVVIINAKYDLEIADGIQLDYNTESLRVGSLHNLTGEIKLYVDDTVRTGMTLVKGEGKTLTWEEMAKINFVNGNTLILDQVNNVITVQ